MRNYARYTCQSCAKRLEAKAVVEVMSCHHGRCDICGIDADLSPTRDYRWGYSWPVVGQLKEESK